MPPRDPHALLSAVAHDLKNPLSSISADAQMMARQVARMEGPEVERLAMRVERIEAATTRMAWLIADLLDLARIEDGRGLQLDRRPIDMVKLAERTLARYQVIARRHELRLECAEGEVMGVWDDARIERVLVNLVEHAVKLSPAGGEVLLRIRRDGDAALVTVLGGGADQALDDGVGLTTARGIAENHGGEIAAEGEGVTLRLPLRPAKS